MIGKRIMRALGGTALLLLIPLALQLTIGTGVDGQGWNWTGADFVAMGALIFSASLIYIFITHNMKETKKRVVVGIAVLMLFVLAWAELAVGIFGTPWAGS